MPITPCGDWCSTTLPGDSYGFRPGTIAVLHPYQDTWFGRLAQFLFGLDLVGSSLVRTVILTRALHLLVHPANANKPGWRPRLEWFGLSAAVVFLGAFLSMAVPNIFLLGAMVGMIALITCYLVPSVLAVTHISKFRAEGEKEGRRRMRLKKRVHSIEIAWLSVLIAACIATLIGFIVACVVQGDDIKVSDARKLRQRILSHTSAPTHAPLGHNAC